MSRKSVLNMDYMSDDMRDTLIREKAKRKRTISKIKDIINKNCKSCWFGNEILSLLHEL